MATTTLTTDETPAAVQLAILALTDDRATDRIHQAAEAVVLDFAASILEQPTGDWSLRNGDTQHRDNVRGEPYRMGPSMTVYGDERQDEGVSIHTDTIGTGGDLYSAGHWSLVSR